MVTKVKGEAIKEGSIPYSALATEVIDKIKNAGCTDWNAQAGEIGYIDNKPFYDIIDEKLTTSDFRYDENERVFVCNLASSDNIYDYYSFKVYKDNMNGTDGVIIDSSVFNVGKGFSNEINFTINNNKFTVSVDVNVKYDEINKSCIIKISARDEIVLEHSLDLLRWVGASNNTVTIRQISDMYLPNTVLKTTLQTFTDEDKNQVLSNLGLSDVVHNSKFTEEVSNINKTIEDNEQVVAAALNELNGELKKSQSLVNITYLELVNLRDNSQLIPGQQYRITDYVTTTTQSDTRVAEEYHQFDIIVTADDVNVLNENARAIQHEEDTYFANYDLNAWELKYCLDNDMARFAWADSANGKGVIYYMKDEWNNECPYDFKNIQFARWELSNPSGYSNANFENDWVEESTPFDSLKTGFYGLSSSGNEFYYVYDNIGKGYKYKVIYIISLSPTYCYTFGKDADYSISGRSYGNVIKEYKYNNKIQLNNIVFLGNNCYSNSFGNSCFSNSFSNSCFSNSFGNNYESNSFGNNCYSNSFGNNCYSNSFGNSCRSNSFGNSCESNSFGNSCESNSFGENCDSNSFNDDCDSNGFGNGCGCNSFGTGCRYNNFGNYCVCNSFGNDCSDNNFGASKTILKSYYRYITFDNGNHSINLECTITTGPANFFQYVRIGLGVNGKTIRENRVNQAYQTLYKPTNSQDLTV